MFLCSGGRFNCQNFKTTPNQNDIKVMEHRQDVGTIVSLAVFNKFGHLQLQELMASELQL